MSDDVRSFLVRLPVELHQRLKSRSTIDGVPMADMVREAMETYLGPPLAVVRTAPPPPPEAPSGPVSVPLVLEVPPSGTCGHPPGRRIKGTCMECGEEVG